MMILQRSGDHPAEFGVIKLQGADEIFIVVFDYPMRSSRRALSFWQTPFDNAGNQRSMLAKLTAAIPGETKVFGIGT